jgi:dGTPase
MEATAVRFADRIAYINHDLDDAIRAGILTPEDVPPGCAKSAATAIPSA